jgi:hypothetical protein
LTISKLLDSGILAEDTQLTPNDIDGALRRMKNGLVMVDLKRRLLSQVDGGAVIELSSEILALQEAA